MFDISILFNSIFGFFLVVILGVMFAKYNDLEYEINKLKIEYENYKRLHDVEYEKDKDIFCLMLQGGGSI